MSSKTFGRRLLEGSLSDATALEQPERAGVFHKVDSIIVALVAAARTGEMNISQGELERLDSTADKTIRETYDRDRLEAAGAWFLPTLKTLEVGWLNFSFFQSAASRFSAASVTSTRVKVDTSDPKAIFLWSVAIPFFDALWAPFRLRGPEAGTKVDKREWEQLRAFYEALQVPPELLAPLLPRAGWSRFAAKERAERKAALYQGVLRALEDGPRVATIYRTLLLRDLATRHYQVGKDGRALRRKALTKPFQTTLVAYFGGDWLRWLEYIEESPHPDEEIIQSLPAPKLFVSTDTSIAERISETAKATGASPARVAEVLAALYGQSPERSPLDERIAVFKEFWTALHEIHRRHTTKEGTLWGLVGERNLPFLRGGMSEPNHGVDTRLLPSALLDRVDRLWGTRVDRRTPDGIVVEHFPRAAMAEAFGLALELWHEVALTAWFVAEGPYSRSSLAGLELYTRKRATVLVEMGTPLPARLFEELTRAEAKRGPPEQLWNNPKSDDYVEFEGGRVSVSFSMSAGQRLGGYDEFRDIITRHRSAWAEQHLEKYLRARWEGELTEVQEQLHRRLADKGKPPTAKQFAAMAEDAANHWFAGDLSRVATAIGVKSPIAPRRTPKLAGRSADFAERVYNRLLSRSGGADDVNAVAAATHLTKHALTFVQIWEATGEFPSFGDGGSKAMDYLREHVFGSLSAEEAWTQYASIVVEEASSNR